MAKLSDLPTIVKNALKLKRILEPAAAEIQTSIKRRTRLGKGVNENLGPNHKLPALTDNTKRIRKELKKDGGLTGLSATPKKSNLSRTGALIDSIKSVASPGMITTSVGTDQEDKVGELISINKNYSFMKLSRAEFRRVLSEINKQINTVLSKINITDL